MIFVWLKEKISMELQFPLKIRDFPFTPTQKASVSRKKGQNTEVFYKLKDGKEIEVEGKRLVIHLKGSLPPPSTMDIG